MLEPPRHVKAMSNLGVGPPFPLFEKKNVLFFSFIEEIKFNTSDGCAWIKLKVLKKTTVFSE
jgi:hypothetical protein